MRLVETDDYTHEAGACFAEPHGHFSEPRWCGHPVCLFEACGGDLAAVEENLNAHGYDPQQVAQMLESYYLPLREQADGFGS